MLAPPLATSGQTTHRFRMSRLDSALGRRKPSLGRSANPWRVTQARDRRLRTHGVAISARPTTGAVTDVAYLPRESPRPVHVPETSRYAPGGDDVADGSGLTFRQTPLSCDAQYASHRCAVGKCPSFQRTLPASISFKITFTTASPSEPAAAGARRRTDSAADPRACPQSRLVLLHRISATNDGVGRLTAGRRLAIVVTCRRRMHLRVGVSPQSEYWRGTTGAGAMSNGS
jgi:hypothetical protein